MYTAFAGPDVVLPDWPHTLVNSGMQTNRPQKRILWEQVVWPISAVSHNLSLLHSMAFVTPLLNNKPSIVTVYDLSFIHYPDRFPKLQRHYLASQTRRSCRAATRVTTISKSGRDDVHEYFGVPLDRIDVVVPGVDMDVYRQVDDETRIAFRKREALPEKFVLHVGTLQPRKNIPTLIDAFAQIEDKSTHLILVGGKGWLYDEIFERVVELGLRDRVRFTGYVADDDLPLWYNSASVLVFPSVYEGFGLPIAEAMACGLPVIAANTSSIPEVAGDAALYFDAQDSATLTERLNQILSDTSLSDTLSAKGLQQVQNFTWPKAGQLMADVYRRALMQ